MIRERMMRMVLKGIAASQGIAIAKVYKLQQPVLTISKQEANVEEELAKLEKAFAKTISDIEAIKDRASANLSEEELAIFDAHLMMANDPEMKGQIEQMIKDQSVNAEYATQEVANMMVAMFESMDNDYFYFIITAEQLIESKNKGYYREPMEKWIESRQITEFSNLILVKCKF